MAESAVIAGNAVVYYYDQATSGWKPCAETGYSSVVLYKNNTAGTYRVIGTGLQNAKGTNVINSPINKDTKYTRSSATFHTWQDSQKIYGVNFANQKDAEGFGGTIDKTVEELKNPPKPAAAKPPPPPAAPPAPKPAPPPPAAPPAPKPAASSGGPPPPPPAPPAPKASGGPPPPPPPPSSSGGGDAPPAGRGDLLNSIQGFSKGGLKKTVTVDKSAPLVEAPKGSSASSGGGGSSAAPAPAPAPSGGGGGGMMAEMMAKRNAIKKPADSGPSPSPAAPKPAPPPASSPKPSPPAPAAPKPAPPAPVTASKPTVAATSASDSSISSAELQNLKQEILSEIRQELAAMKQEILDAINSR